MYVCLYVRVSVCVVCCYCCCCGVFLSFLSFLFYALVFNKDIDLLMSLIPINKDAHALTC